MKKRFLSVALAAAVAMSATACTSNPAESKTTAAPAETKAEETTAAEASSEGEKKEAAAGGRGEVLYKKSGNDPDRKKQAYSAKTPGHDESKMCCRCFAADVAHNC